MLGTLAQFARQVRELAVAEEDLAEVMKRVGRLPELHRELAKETLLTHIAAGALDFESQWRAGFGV